MPRFISRGSATPVNDFTESRTRGHVFGSVAGNPGTLCRKSLPSAAKAASVPLADMYGPKPVPFSLSSCTWVGPSSTPVGMTNLTLVETIKV
jgi:hypothetical protein